MSNSQPPSSVASPADKVVLVDTIVGANGTTAFHFAMHHGFEHGRGATDILPATAVWPDDTSPEQIGLIRNYYRTPLLIQPGITPLIAGDLVPLLAGIPSIKLLDTYVKLPVMIPFSEADASFYDSEYYLSDPLRHTPYSYLLNQPPSPPSVAVNYYEIAMYSIHALQATAESQRYSVATRLGGSTEIELPLSIAYLRDYPISRCQYGVLYRMDVFDRLADYFDRNYFVLSSLSVIK